MLNGRKIYLDGWLNILINNINYNTNINNQLYNQTKKKECQKYIDRNTKLIDKINKYKKIDNSGRVYFYFFPSELETIMWIMLENSCKYIEKKKTIEKAKKNK